MVNGAIVIARYGGSWRGIKASKVAAEHGALACIIYSDPRDDGYFVDDVFPAGPERPRDGAQRGSGHRGYAALSRRPAHARESERRKTRSARQFPNRRY